MEIWREWVIPKKLVSSSNSDDSMTFSFKPTSQTFQEKSQIQGWPIEAAMSGNLTCRQYGMAIGNSWPLPLAARILYQVCLAMEWSKDDVKDPCVWNALDRLGGKKICLWQDLAMLIFRSCASAYYSLAAFAGEFGQNTPCTLGKKS